MIAYQMLRIAMRAMSTVLGGVGVFAVYVSFYHPTAGATAILTLGAALAMNRAIEERR